MAIKKQLRAGIVYNPLTKELFSAQIGKGAYKNGFPIHVSSTTGSYLSALLFTILILSLIRINEEADSFQNLDMCTNLIPKLLKIFSFSSSIPAISQFCFFNLFFHLFIFCRKFSNRLFVVFFVFFEITGYYWYLLLHFRKIHLSTIGCESAPLSALIFKIF